MKLHASYYFIVFGVITTLNNYPRVITIEATDSNQQNMVCTKIFDFILLQNKRVVIRYVLEVHKWSILQEAFSYISYYSFHS